MRYIRITEEPRRSAKVFIDRQRRFDLARENHRLWWQSLNVGALRDYKEALIPGTRVYDDFMGNIASIGSAVSALVSLDDNENPVNCKEGALATGEFFRLRADLREAFPYPLGYRGDIFRSGEGKKAVHAARCPDCGGSGITDVHYVGMPTFFVHQRCPTCEGFGSMHMEGRSDGRKAK